MESAQDLSTALFDEVYNAEMQKLEQQVQKKILENQVILEYIKLFDKDIETMQIQIKSRPAPRPQIDFTEHIGDLETTFLELYEIFYSGIDHSDEDREAMREVEADVLLTYQGRKTEYEKMKKQCDNMFNNPETLKSLKELETSKEELNAESKLLEKMEEEEKELKMQVDAKEKQLNEELANVHKQIAEKEKALHEAQQFMEDQIEDRLYCEKADLEKEKKKLKKQLNIEEDDDDYSSISSFLSSIPVHIPVIKKITTDLEWLFKNPNDIPSLLTGISSPSKMPSSSNANKNTIPLPVVKKIDRSLKQKNVDTSLDKRKQQKHVHLSNRPKISWAHAPTPRLRSAVAKRKSSVVIENKEPPVKIKCVEVSKASSVSNESVKIAIISDEIVESSDPVPYQPRSLNKLFGVVKASSVQAANVMMVEHAADHVQSPKSSVKAVEIAQKSSPEDSSRNPGDDGETEQIVIEETPLDTEDEEMQDEMMLQVPKDPNEIVAQADDEMKEALMDKDMDNVDPLQGKLSRCNSTTSFGTNNFDEDFADNDALFGGDMSDVSFGAVCSTSSKDNNEADIDDTLDFLNQLNGPSAFNISGSDSEGGGNNFFDESPKTKDKTVDEPMF